MIKKVIKWWLIIKLSAIILFVLFYFISSSIVINKNQDSYDQVIYLKDNGRHIDIIIKENDKYIEYGWGSEIFYLNVPTWDDLTFSIVFKALFTKPNSLMHVTTFNNVEDDWIIVNVNSVMTSLTIKPYLALIRYVNEKRKIRRIGQYFAQDIGTRNFLHPMAQGGEFWREDMLKLINEIEDYDGRSLFKNHLIGIWKSFEKTKPNKKLIWQ